MNSWVLTDGLESEKEKKMLEIKIEKQYNRFKHGVSKNRADTFLIATISRIMEMHQFASCQSLGVSWKEMFYYRTVNRS